MRFLIGFMTALVLLALAGLSVIWTGIYNVAASDPHYDPVRWGLETTMHNSVERRARDIQAPARFTEEQLRAGFESFNSMCVQCHGAPGREQAEWARGMRPRPPDLSGHATHWNAAQVFWIVKHGIKMSAMPAFGRTHTDEDIWSIVAFVEQLPAMTPEAFARFKEALGSAAHGNAAGHHGKAGAATTGRNGAASPPPAPSAAE